MWSGLPLGPIAGNTRSPMAMTCRPSCWIGTPTRPTVPKGIRSVKWTPGHDVSGDPVFRIRFDRATCRACPTRQVCTTAKDAPRQLTVRPQAHHEAMQAARQRQETPEFKEKYALRSGVESSLSQGIRRFDLRQSRYIGLARHAPPADVNGHGDECRPGGRLASGQTFRRKKTESGTLCSARAGVLLSRGSCLCWRDLTNSTS